HVSAGVLDDLPGGRSGRGPIFLAHRCLLLSRCTACQDMTRGRGKSFPDRAVNNHGAAVGPAVVPPRDAVEVGGCPQVRQGPGGCSGQAPWWKARSPRPAGTRHIPIDPTLPTGSKSL